MRLLLDLDAPMVDRYASESDRIYVEVALRLELAVEVVIR